MSPRGYSEKMSVLLVAPTSLLKISGRAIRTSNRKVVVGSTPTKERSDFSEYPRVTIGKIHHDLFIPITGGSLTSNISFITIPKSYIALIVRALLNGTGRN